jgi:hypothetical protein
MQCNRRERLLRFVCFLWQVMDGFVQWFLNTFEICEYDISPHYIYSSLHVVIPFVLLN